MAIQGNGMFILSNGANNFYTRAGSFNLDANGDLVNLFNGYHVQGWIADATGAIDTSGAIGNINIPVGSTVPALATSTIDYANNLDASAATGDTYVTSINVYDSLGEAHNVTITFTKNVALRTWTWAASGADVTAGNGSVNYNDDGSWNTTTVTNAISLSVAPATTPQTVTPDFSNTTQYAATNSLIASSQNGYASGSLLSFNVGNTGVITGTYSNGRNQALAQVALAHFANYGGLLKEGDTMFSETVNSGIALTGIPDTGGRGTISSGSLEMSNVDLSEEFTQMIIAERGFQANSRSITTSDEILQELLTLKR
jgi:flagellar hook protein FlgE